VVLTTDQRRATGNDEDFPNANFRCQESRIVAYSKLQVREVRLRHDFASQQRCLSTCADRSLNSKPGAMICRTTKHNFARLPNQAVPTQRQKLGGALALVMELTTTFQLERHKQFPSSFPAIPSRYQSTW